MLYLRGALACRRCTGLAYASSREDATDRALRRANVLRARLGWRRGIVHSIGPRTPGMHRRTYTRLALEYWVHNQEAMRGLKGQLERVIARTWPGGRV